VIYPYASDSIAGKRHSKVIKAKVHHITHFCSNYL